jgi:hypothetical protein
MEFYSKTTAGRRMHRLPAIHIHTHWLLLPYEHSNFRVRIFKYKIKNVCFMLAVYTSCYPSSLRIIATLSTLHLQLSKTVIDGENYLCFSLCLSTSLITSFQHVTPAGDVSFSPLMAKILSITFASHCYNRRTSLFPLGFLNVILNTRQPLLSLEEWI